MNGCIVNFSMEMTFCYLILLMYHANIWYILIAEATGVIGPSLAGTKWYSETWG